MNNATRQYDCECSKAELELFTTPPVNVSMDRGEFTAYHPLSTISDDGPLEFTVPGTPEEYIDVGRTKLFVKLKITKLDGSNIAADAKVSSANLLLHSLFSQIDLKLNERLVTPSVNTYPYKAYLETLLSHGKGSKESWLMGEMWRDDDTSMAANDPEADDANPGLVARAAELSGSKVVEMIGRPHCDLFQQDRYLLNGVTMALKLTRSTKNFHLMAPDAAAFKVVLLDAALHVRKVKINPTIALHHAKILDQGKTAKYPLRRGVVTTFTVGQGSLSFNKENLVAGQLPRRVVIGFVTNKAFNGAATDNPFLFQNFDLNFLTLSTGSQHYPSQPLNPNYRAGEYIEAFNALYQNTGMVNSDRGMGITPTTFKEGHCLYAFDLTADMAEGAHVDPIKYGSLRMEAHFARALGTPVNAVVYAEYDNLLQIDRARNVIVDFAAS